MSEHQVNGDGHPSLATLSHITAYPLVSDGLTYIRKSPYGQRSIELGGNAYDRFAKPVLPYLAGGYEYVSPYVKRADDMADHALSKMDERIPALKKPTDELWADGMTLIYFPVNKGTEARDHVIGVYNSELKKIGGDGLVVNGKALVSAGLVITTETLVWVGDLLRAGQAKSKEAGNDAAHALN
ncbi:sporulation-specific protein 4 [Microdochium nivale]|nr:sporulation-specific protein 4 [Microdochium nivale]